MLRTDAQITSIPVYFLDEPVPSFVDPEQCRDIAVRFCKLCGTNKLRVPLFVLSAPGKGKWRSQGLDIFYIDRPIEKAHKCVSRVTPAGIWVDRKCLIKQEHYDSLLQVEGIGAGPPVSDNSFRK